MTAGETWDSCLEEIRQLPSVKKYGDDVKVSMYMYDRPSWTGEVYETECYFPTWINKENAAHVQALVDAHHALYGEERIGPDGAMHLRHRPLIDKWTFSTNGVAIQGRYGIPCVGFGPGAESQAHAPNEITWKQPARSTTTFSNSHRNRFRPFLPSTKYRFIKEPIIMDATLQKYIDKLNALNFKEMYEGDFFLTWDKSDDELEAVFTVADALRYMRENNISTKIFESGLGISLFRDNSTRTRFSFASACNLLGLEVQDLDEGKSQIAHGETVRDMYIGKGHTYQKEVAEAVTQGHKDGVLEQKPTLINLQCDIDHPTQCMADMLHIIHHFGGVENLRGKKIAMTWAYSPSYGKPLSVPQGVIGLMSRFGMDVVLAHPEGYEVMPEVEEVAKANAAKTGGSFTKTNSMAEAFKDADIVYPKSWAPFAAMEKRTNLYAEGDADGIKALEKELLAQNADHKDWCCTEELMKTTKDGKALYLHCLPADINDVSCKDGEVEASVFDRYRTPLYKEASYKPYIIAAMIFLAKVKDPQATLKALEERGIARWFQK